MFQLIRIDLDWDSKTQLVTKAKRLFHQSPSRYKYSFVDVPRVPFDDLDWNDLRDRLEESFFTAGGGRQRTRRT